MNSYMHWHLKVFVEAQIPAAALYLEFKHSETENIRDPCRH